MAKTTELAKVTIYTWKCTGQTKLKVIKLWTQEDKNIHLFCFLFYLQVYALALFIVLYLTEYAQ